MRAYKRQRPSHAHLCGFSAFGVTPTTGCSPGHASPVFESLNECPFRRCKEWVSLFGTAAVSPCCLALPQRMGVPVSPCFPVSPCLAVLCFAASCTFAAMSGMRNGIFSSEATRAAAIRCAVGYFSGSFSTQPTVMSLAIIASSGKEADSVSCS